MRSQFGHMGDAFESIREIYESLPQKSSQRSVIKKFAFKLAELSGEWENLEAYWPEALDKEMFSSFYTPLKAAKKGCSAG